MPKARRVQSGEEPPAFDANTFLESAGAARNVVSYPEGKIVFSQGQPSDTVMYIQKGGIKISVLSRTGKEAVVAMLGPGDFFGEGALTGQSIRIGTATATMLTAVLVIEKAAMLQLLRDEPTFSERFIAYMLARNIRIEADLVDHLFNSSEKRGYCCCWAECRPSRLADVAVRVRPGVAGPLANYSTQLVGLLLQLMYPLRLHGEIAAQFRDLAFDNIRQFGRPRPSVSA